MTWGTPILVGKERGKGAAFVTKDIELMLVCWRSADEFGVEQR